MKFHEISSLEISVADFITSILLGGEGGIIIINTTPKQQQAVCVMEISDGVCLCKGGVNRA